MKKLLKNYYSTITPKGDFSKDLHRGEDKRGGISLMMRVKPIKSSKFHVKQRGIHTKRDITKRDQAENL